jgi:hypothetical protein
MANDTLAMTRKYLETFAAKQGISPVQAEILAQNFGPPTRFNGLRVGRPISERKRRRAMAAMTRKGPR